MPTRTLRGWRVLVPRGGIWGDHIAALLRRYGATPVVAPMINFANAEDGPALARALVQLQDGAYSWVIVPSAASVDVLVGHGTSIPRSTRIATVGGTVADALRFAGYRADFVPELDHSARGMVNELNGEDLSGRILVLQSDVGEPGLISGLSELGVEPEVVEAYRIVGVQVPEQVRSDVASGAIGAILVTSPAIAREVASQLAPLPEQAVVACIGPRAAYDARAVGISVTVIAEDRSVESLIQELADHVASS